MSQGQPCLVGALGLLEHEIRLVKSIIKHSNERHPERYEWSDDFSELHIILVSADNELALAKWQEQFKNNPLVYALMITSKDQVVEAEYFFARPFSPTKVATLLDRMLKEKLVAVLEHKIFEGQGQSLQRFVTPIKADSAKHRALVVDDSPTVRKQLELELVSLKMLVDMAETGEQCLEMVERSNYDIIFLDVVLPGADGYEVCKKIKKNFAAKNTPVVMLTSKSSSFDRVRGAMAGCNSYLTKPVDYEKFHKVLEQYLGS